jgi:SAM-dependent methyltransferase
MSRPSPTPERHYLLGHGGSELRRLDLQGSLYRDVTLRAFETAGLAPGMRVLDIGCGTGDVTLTAAEVVGSRGAVLGVDRGTQAIETAAAKARSSGLTQVSFECAELEAFERRGAFDALVGRFVLMHQPDPPSVLRHLVRSVRPGGVVVLIESWMEVLRAGSHSQPHSPLYDDIVKWSCAVVGGAGADLSAGGRLRTTFLESGLPGPETRLEALVAGGPDSVYYDYVEQSVRSMLPEARRLGLSGYDEAAADGLAARLRDEVVESGGSLLAWPVVAAWGRVEA